QALLADQARGKTGPALKPVLGSIHLGDIYRHWRELVHPCHPGRRTLQRGFNDFTEHKSIDFKVWTFGPNPPADSTRPKGHTPFPTALVREQAELAFLVCLRNQNALRDAQELARKVRRASGPELVANLKDVNPSVRALSAAAIGQRRIPAGKELSA